MDPFWSGQRNLTTTYEIGRKVSSLAKKHFDITLPWAKIIDLRQCQNQPECQPFKEASATPALFLQKVSEALKANTGKVEIGSLVMSY